MIMAEDSLILMAGFAIIVIVTVIAVAVAMMQLRSAERRMHESTIRFKTYTDLLNAITELNLAGGDSYKMEAAKKNLALTLNRLNLGGHRCPAEHERPAGLLQ